MNSFSVVVIGCEEEKEMELTVDLTRLRAMPQERPFPTGVLFGVRRGPPEQGGERNSQMHFVTLSNCGQGVNDVGRVGVWLDESVGPLQVLLWDRHDETFTVLSPDAPQHKRVQEMIDGGAHLCEYAYANIWKSFSSGITSRVLERLLIPPGVHTVAGNTNDTNDPESQGPSSAEHMETSAQRKERHVEALLHQRAKATGQLTPFFADNAGGRVPSWPELYPPTAAIARMPVPERTSFYFDSSQRLEWVLGHCGGEGALIGGLKVAFVHFLLLACQASLEHWKHVIKMLCTCGDSAVCRHTDMFAAFLRGVSAHLLCADFNELLADPDSSAYEFFEECFGGLYEVLGAECFGSVDLMRASGSLRRALVKRCGIDPGNRGAIDEGEGPVLLCEDGSRELTEGEAQDFLEEMRKEEGPHTCSERRRRARGTMDVEEGKETYEPSSMHVERRNRLSEAIDSVQLGGKNDKDKGFLDGSTMDVEYKQTNGNGENTKKVIQPSFKNRRKKKQSGPATTPLRKMNGPMSFGDEDDI